MKLLETEIDHAECLKRTDHWVFLTLLVLFGGLVYMKDRHDSQNTSS
jgi:hypothetical protein